jgi:hypothetical protein
LPVDAIISDISVENEDADGAVISIASECHSVLFTRDVKQHIRAYRSRSAGIDAPHARPSTIFRDELNAGADPSTLVRAARDFCGKEPQFAATVALLALSSFLAGGGYDPSVSEVDDAVKHLLAASCQIESVDWALRELGKLAERQCAAGREPFQHAIKAALSRWHPGEHKV